MLNLFQFQFIILISVIFPVQDALMPFVFGLFPLNPSAPDVTVTQMSALITGGRSSEVTGCRCPAQWQWPLWSVDDRAQQCYWQWTCQTCGSFSCTRRVPGECQTWRKLHTMSSVDGWWHRQQSDSRLQASTVSAFDMTAANNPIVSHYTKASSTHLDWAMNLATCYNTAPYYRKFV